MVLDSSAVVALMLREPSAEILEAAMRGTSAFLMGTPAILETAMVVGSRHPNRGAHNLDAFLAARRIEIIPFDVEQLHAAREAFRRFGRGSGSKARLNFGDCCAYALAKVRDEPLLFVGDDFRHTDIVAAL
jgi:ribonuclease VapC